MVTPESSIAKSTTPSSTSTSAPSRTRTSAWPVASWNPSTHTTVNSSLTTTIGKCDHRLVWNQSIVNPEGFLKNLENYLLTYFFLHRCYLGNFRTSSTVSSSTAQVTAYILKTNVASMKTKLFPHSMEVATNIWTTHRETTVTGVTSEPICQVNIFLSHFFFL